MASLFKECEDCLMNVASFNVIKGRCIACHPFKRVASSPGPFKTRRTFGVEFEVEFDEDEMEIQYNSELNPDFKNWARHEDGSLDNGWEYVSPIFAGYNKPVKMIREFCDAVKKEGALTPHTTGTHIHLGISDFNCQQKMRLMKNAVNVQEQVKRLVHRNRFNSGFVEAIVDEYDYYDDIEEIISDRMEDHYTWMNFSESHPTVEIRALEGTLDAKRVEHWIELWLGFVKVSKRGKIKDIFEAMNRAGTRPETIKYFKDNMR